jgi:beta-glucosidase
MIKKFNFLLPFIISIIFSCSNKKITAVDVLEARIDTLLHLMSLDEKIGQMNQLNSTGKVNDFFELIKSGQVGSFLNEIDPAKINEMQKIAVEECRLRIPLVFARDVIHGFKTILPIPLGQAATWNPELIEAGAGVAATEASETGIRWTFAPMIDISRDPRWGRIAESLGEDPLLTSILGASMVKGFQGKSLSASNSIAACVKHYAAYGAVEGGRDYNSVTTSEQALREIYLSSFKASVDAGAATLMTSFNEINGVPSSCNEFLLKKVLRDEWKFNGVVVSDWASVEELIPHGICVDGKDAAAKAANAGVDIEMVSSLFSQHLKELLKEGKVTEKAIDDAVRNILRLKYRLGLFKNPYVKINVKSSAYSEEHLKLARELATQSIVLLKNKRNILPLKKGIKTIAVIGPLADAPYDQMGTWVLDGDAKFTQTPLMALKQEFSNKVKILYEKGLEFSRDKNKSNFKKALKASKMADAVIIFAGEESILSGEARCRADISLPGAQSQLIEEMKNSGKPIILVILAGRPLTIQKECDLADAVLYAWHPGTMGGPAIADILLGKVLPSGKLPVTFPKMVGQIPIYYSHKNTGRPVGEPLELIDDIPVAAPQFSVGNYCYYLDAGDQPLFPFGYGLSYTTYKYTDLDLSDTIISAGDKLKISCNISNTGNFEGTEIVQLYTRDLVGSLTRPVKELKGFQRITLKPGEKKQVIFMLSTDDLSYWNANMKKVAEPGKFRIWLGGSSESGLETEFTLCER